MTEPKLPPAGVETTPQGPVVSINEAAARLGKDKRTLIKAIHSGELRGGAEPRPKRLRWYVYADELPPEPGGASTDAALRAQVISLQEANRLLIAAQQELLEADRSSQDSAEHHRAAARHYLDALAQFMTPGHLGDLAEV
ncbi:MAG: hypothetical protein AB7G47_10680 [Mycolicibacterium sp.]|uniref:hypothetical protein n=1 Tax=Mycolicibacterium sp. TaxID=2320850 RepID=UPI003D0A323C